MHVAREEIMQYLELFAEGYGKEGVANKVGLTPAKLNQRLNYYKFKMTNIRAWQKEKKTAIYMYDSMYPNQLPTEKLQDTKDVIVDKLLNDLIDTISLNTNVLRELTGILCNVAREFKPKEEKKKDKDPTRVARSGNLRQPKWTRDDIDLLTSLVFAKAKDQVVRRFCEEIKHQFPGRSVQAIATQYYQVIKHTRIAA